LAPLVTDCANPRLVALPTGLFRARKAKSGVQRNVKIVIDVLRIVLGSILAVEVHPDAIGDLGVLDGCCFAGRADQLAVLQRLALKSRICLSLIT
ncbi:hypothetical protein ACWGJQ_28775, partial [Peribacillus simplex]